MNSELGNRITRFVEMRAGSSFQQVVAISELRGGGYEVRVLGSPEGGGGSVLLIHMTSEGELVVEDEMGWDT